MLKLRPYISGPMAGNEHLNLPAFFEVEERLEAECWPINPARVLPADTWEIALNRALASPKQWTDYLHHDLMLLVTQANAIVMLPGWQKSKGACVELVTAVSCGFEVYEWHDGLVPLRPATAYPLALKHLTACLLGGVPESPQLTA